MKFIKKYVVFPQIAIITSCQCQSQDIQPNIKKMGGRTLSSQNNGYLYIFWTLKYLITTYSIL